LTKNLAVVRNCSFPTVSGQKAEVRTPVQFKAILKALPPEEKLMALLGGTCGLRQGEKSLEFECRISIWKEM